MIVEVLKTLKCGKVVIPAQSILDSRYHEIPDFIQNEIALNTGTAQLISSSPGESLPPSPPEESLTSLGVDAPPVGDPSESSDTSSMSEGDSADPPPTLPKTTKPKTTKPKTTSKKLTKPKTTGKKLTKAKK